MNEREQQYRADMFARLLNSTDRFKRLLELNAPETIIDGEVALFVGYAVMAIGDRAFSNVGKMILTEAKSGYGNYCRYDGCYEIQHADSACLRHFQDEQEVIKLIQEQEKRES
jgi:hypothetical protein